MEDTPRRRTHGSWFHHLRRSPFWIGSGCVYRKIPRRDPPWKRHDSSRAGSYFSRSENLGIRRCGRDIPMTCSCRQQPSANTWFLFQESHVRRQSPRGTASLVKSLCVLIGKNELFGKSGSVLQRAAPQVCSRNAKFFRTADASRRAVRVIGSEEGPKLLGAQQ